jgi:hypothetical protein
MVSAGTNAARGCEERRAERGRTGRAAGYDSAQVKLSFLFSLFLLILFSVFYCS